MDTNMSFKADIDAYFVKQQAVFNAHFRRLVAMRETLKELDASFGSPSHQLDEYGTVRWSAPSTDLDSVLSLYDWSFKYDIVHCNALLYRLCSQTEAKLYKDLAEMFNVRILHVNRLIENYFKDRKWMGVEPDLSIVKEAFFSLFEGRSLQEQQLYDLRGYLRNWLFMKVIDMNQNVLSFRRMFRLSAWTLRMVHEDRKLLCELLRLLVFHFTGAFDMSSLLSAEQLDRLSDQVRRSVFAELNSDYLKRIEIDDNGNLLLDFCNEAQAQSFLHLLREVISEPSMNLDF